MATLNRRWPTLAVQVQRLAKYSRTVRWRAGRDREGPLHARCRRRRPSARSRRSRSACRGRHAGVDRARPTRTSRRCCRCCGSVLVEPLSAAQSGPESSEADGRAGRVDAVEHVASSCAAGVAAQVRLGRELRRGGGGHRLARSRAGRTRSAGGWSSRRCGRCPSRPRARCGVASMSKTPTPRARPGSHSSGRPFFGSSAAMPFAGNRTRRRRGHRRRSCSASGSARRRTPRCR